MRLFPAVVAILLASQVSAQHMNHGDHGTHMQHQQRSAPAATEAGQSAFAAIQEIVDILQADPDTDWTNVNIDALRQHLVDMDNVTTRASVRTQQLNGAVAFLVSSQDPDVIASIQRMVIAHAAVMNGVDGMEMRASPRDYGALLGVEGDLDRINGLGFFGIMASGMHHQAHHLAIARGESPHH